MNSGLNVARALRDKPFGKNNVSVFLVHAGIASP